ncbi:helix-turn-helix domain-containing protein [Rhodophyticola porphyridii]|uniref:XRE family transcriptional regulator n=1 Tax=Rhodophyticola porphyridii TaxID=1852017 RepID=A0A3L9XZB0_9RHOB|nr:helix-turn-helix transcriptional regulator [Rhodophyticola porphyridii]RMA41572.1 XRE family transcriptional regulator [Rhodophyticola porphyridii]
MTYASEDIAATLKNARNNKGLSQRELSARSGVPQSHISKIESNAVDLRLSSLASLAHALDLELALIPRKAAPAVRSIARSTSSHTLHGHSDALRELTKANRAFAALPKALHESSAAHTLQKQLAEMSNFRNILQETDAVRQMRKALETIENAGGLKQLEKVAKDAQRLRNMLAHNISATHSEPAQSRPAYSLDEEDSDG